MGDDVIVPDLPEIYKRVIVLMRSVYATMRLVPTSKLVRAVQDRRPYTDSPIGLTLKMKCGQQSHGTDSWEAIPGTEHLEQTSRLELAPVITAHGTLKICLEHRQQFEFSLETLGESVGSLKESFEELGKVPVIPKRLSQVSSIGSSPSSPRLRLGRGAASSPRRTMSQPNIPAAILATAPASTSTVTSPLPSPGGSRARTSSVLAIGSHLAKSPPSSITGSSLYVPMSPSVLGDTALTQFMKQCENHPTLESLRVPARDESILLRRAEKLRDQLSTELELWLSDFRAVESLSAPLPRPKSQDASVYSQTKLPTVSPVIECQSEDNSIESSNTSEDYHLMFPL